MYYIPAIAFILTLKLNLLYIEINVTIVDMVVNIMKIFLADMTQTQKLTQDKKITHYSMQSKEGSLQKEEKLKKWAKNVRLTEEWTHTLGCP